MKNPALNTLIFLLFSGISMFGCKPGSNQESQGPQLGIDSIQSVIAAMTLEEKAKLVVGMGFHIPGPPPGSDTTHSLLPSNFVPPPDDPDAEKFPEKVPGAAGRTHPIPRLGIPMITVADGPAGVRIDPKRESDTTKTYYATAFPVATLLASSWDTTLVYSVGEAFGGELRDYGIDILLAPALNIHRNPLGGRNFEYYSEDPLIAGAMAAAMVNGVQSKGVGTSIKHFVANNQETSRNSINTVVSERALREIYLKGFKIAIKRSSPWTVMSSYNKVNGTYASQSHDLLTTILRNDWGFKGFVMTDWFGGKDAVEQMQAGNDLLMPGNPNQSNRIVSAVNHDSLDVHVLDQNVERILNIIMKSPAFNHVQYNDQPDLKTDAAIARSAAEEGMVLLKNNGSVLPFREGVKQVALFGNTSYKNIAGGTGSGDVHKAYNISLARGMKNNNYLIDDQLERSYTQYLEQAKMNMPMRMSFFQLPPPVPEMMPDDILLQDLATNADIAIFTIGRNAGEGADRDLTDDYYLSNDEKDLLKQISDAFHAQGKKLVVVLNIGGVIEVASWRDMADAILLAWQPGQEGGNAITDILDGTVNPSGKLATTFPMDYNEVPSSKNFPGTPEDKPKEVVYEEGIYVGYRYYDKYRVKTAYEFGYGLSYTNFTYGKLQLSASEFNDQITASLDITNSGKVAGKEVVELYIKAPAKQLDKPVRELRAFAKTKLLQPGEKQSLTFDIYPEDLASYNTNKEAWIAEAGKYSVEVGASSVNIKHTADFSLANDLTVKQDEKALAPQMQIPEFR